MKQNKLLMGIAITFISIFALVVLSALILWSHRNEVVTLEENIKAQHVANQSNYDNMWKSFKEMTQVTEIQAEQFKDVYQGFIEGRNQDEGLLFKMVQESNPQLSQEVYTQLQREIRAGRLQFDNNQKKIADMVGQYNILVRKYVVMTAITGRTTMDANSLIVTSEKTENVFKTGKDNQEIDLSGKK